MARGRKRVLDAGVMLIVPVLVFVLWWVLSRDSTSPYYPPLSNILTAFKDTWLFTHFESDILPSLYRLALGFAISVVVGVSVGVALGRSRLMARAFLPIVDYWRAVPATALIPPAIVLMGIGDSMKIVLIAFTCVFPILISTVDGVRALDKTLDDVARSFRLTRAQRVKEVILPAAGPQVFAGMRISLAISFILMITSETVAATNGIGYVTFNAQQTFRISEMWSGMLLLGLLGAAINGLFLFAERRILRWHHGMHRTSGH